MLGLLPSSLFTHHVGEGSASGPSPRIMACIAGQATNPDGSERLYTGVEQDFDGHLDTAAGASGSLARGTYVVDTGGTLVSDLTSAGYGGVLKMSTAATDNHEVWWKTGVLGELDTTLPFFFEARVRIPTTFGTSFIGLTAPGAVALDVMTDADATPDANYFGFKINSSGQITFISRKAGAAELILAATAVMGSASTSAMMRLGFVYGGRGNSNDGLCNVYIDNVRKVALTSANLVSAQTPKDTPLAGIVGFKNTAATATTMSIDWMYGYSLMA